MKRLKGKLFIISGPSQVGKDSVVADLLKIKKIKLATVITYTTRTIRQGEQKDKVHKFVKEKFFRKLIKQHQLLEWKNVHGKHYGTPKKEVLNKLAAGYNVILNIDVKGALKVKKHLPKSILIFITAESIREIKRRIYESPIMNLMQKNRRWLSAQKELRYQKYYNYTVINRWNKLPQTINQIIKIITKYLK